MRIFSLTLAVSAFAFAPLGLANLDFEEAAKEDITTKKPAPQVKPAPGIPGYKGPSSDPKKRPPLDKATPKKSPHSFSYKRDHKYQEIQSQAKIFIDSWVKRGNGRVTINFNRNATNYHLIAYSKELNNRKDVTSLTLRGKILSLPSDFGKGMTNLEYLNLSGLGLNKLPKMFGADFTKLKTDRKSVV